MGSIIFLFKIFCCIIKFSSLFTFNQFSARGRISLQVKEQKQLLNQGNSTSLGNQMPTKLQQPSTSTPTATTPTTPNRLTSSNLFKKPSSDSLWTFKSRNQPTAIDRQRAILNNVQQQQNANVRQVRELPAQPYQLQQPGSRNESTSPSSSTTSIPAPKSPRTPRLSTG